MADIWVDPLFGIDSNSGANPANAKATFAAGYAAVTAGAVLHLLGGSYTDQISTFVLSKSNVTIRAEGPVRMISTTGAAAFHSGFAGYITRIVGVRFENFLELIRAEVSGGGAAQGNATPANGIFLLKNCVISRSSAGGALVSGLSGNYTNYTGTFPTNATVGLGLDGCTIRNYSYLFSGNKPMNSGLCDLSFFDMQNNIIDGYSNFLNVLAGAPTVSYPANRFRDFNAFSSASGVNGTPAGQVGSLYSHSPAYTNTGASPPDLSISPTSGSALIGAGRFGGNIGAPFWPSLYSGQDTIISATDWTNWSNDEKWYDTALSAPGTEGPVDASPAILVLSEPKVWIIHPTRGQQKSARVIGPVWDFGATVNFKALGWKATEVSPANLISNAQDYTSPSPGPQIEVRYSNTAFARTDTNPTNWTLISKKQLPSLSARYWQVRAVLRTDAF